MIRLKRVSEKPILEPEISHPWEASAVLTVRQFMIMDWYT